MSRTFKLITYLVGYGVCLGIPLAIYLCQKTYLPIMIVCPILFLAYLFRPLGYTIGSGEIGIKRPIGCLHIPFSSIREVKDAANITCRMSVGLCRVGGFYGTYGIFWNAAYPSA